MFEFFQQVAAIAVPVFVIAIMLNVGLTQRASRILECLKGWPFVLRMLVANFVAAPVAMILIVRVLDLAPAFEAGLLVYSLSAGAPFLIKLTEAAEHDVALGASTMLVLMVLTVAYLPLVLPRFVEGTEVDAGAVGRTLVLQMMVPLVAGMIAVQVAERISSQIQPWVARVGNITLPVVIGAIIVGYLPAILDMIGGGAIFAMLLFTAAALGFGWLAGAGNDALQDVGALATAQRNNAAALIVAAENFDDPAVLVVIAVGSTVVLLLLMPIARRLARDDQQPGVTSAPASREGRP